MLFFNFNTNIYLLIIFKAAFTNLEEPSLQRTQIDIKWWFERPLKNQSLVETETEKAIDFLLLVHDPPMV